MSETQLTQLYKQINACSDEINATRDEMSNILEPSRTTAK